MGLANTVSTITGHSDRDTTFTVSFDAVFTVEPRELSPPPPAPRANATSTSATGTIWPRASTRCHPPTSPPPRSRWRLGPALQRTGRAAAPATDRPFHAMGPNTIGEVEPVTLGRAESLDGPIREYRTGTRARRTGFLGATREGTYRCTDDRPQVGRRSNPQSYKACWSFLRVDSSIRAIVLAAMVVAATGGNGHTALTLISHST